MAPRSLAAWLTNIEQRHPAGMHLGLERIRAVIDRLGLAAPAPVVVTVAGTNGKGSTVALLEGCYRAAGYRTGAYTSPHLRRFNERVRIDGCQAEDAVLCAAFEAVEAAREDLQLTYFEFATAAALLVFRDAGLDVALLEVGLGGRLDAVNAVDGDAAVVVSVGLDHMEWLGPTREDIGWEKAHVYRPGRPAVCADPDPPERLLAHAESIGADLRLIGRDFRVEAAADGEGWHWVGSDACYRDLPPLAARGTFQRQNAAAALAVVDALSPRLPTSVEALRRGLRETTIEGRVQLLTGDVSFIFDVAHNVHAAAALAATLKAGFDGTSSPVPGRTLAVFGIMRDKDVSGVVRELAPVVDEWFAAGLDPPRGLSAARLSAVLATHGCTQAGAFDTVAEACAAARAAARPGDRVVVFGSFLVVGPGLDAVSGG